MSTNTKKNIMIRIDQEVVRKAKKIGLNLSKVAENAFIKAITALERMDDLNEPTNYPVSYLNENNGGPSRIRTGGFRLVKAAS